MRDTILVVAESATTVNDTIGVKQDDSRYSIVNAIVKLTQSFWYAETNLIAVPHRAWRFA